MDKNGPRTGELWDDIGVGQGGRGPSRPMNTDAVVMTWTTATKRNAAGADMGPQGQIIPERRFVEAVNREAYQYQIGDFPVEWEAWIRKKRDDPPTIEEILRNENYREEMKQKVKDVSEKDKLLQAKEYEEGLVAEPSHTQVKGHASAPYYGKKEPSQDPTSTANIFQPGAWMPPGSDSSQNK
ncbi:NADH dehydrogenase [ubiquinone] 1 alpha subcomplex assembly factor 2 isoform X1 [Vidua macroura]|uniref:NADH dehydrogenase [ubiquinone] 1 alpha subcomplex assembly factor 2 isoform X1 n=1 Tax=Vidua macroura TaxID=187451 RepID=UPI0023A8921D|nr:NADH dehydrogenase [ubiquinone] 1 alpha subcomplex assembly factor 2 isoform X1 [Vidua macroura]